MLRAKQQDALIVTHLPDVRYLCGFTGSNAALVIVATGRTARARLFTDGRYTAQAAHEVQGATVRIAKKSALAEAILFTAKSSARNCAFDADTVSVATLATMRKALQKASSTRLPSFLRPSPSPVAPLRVCKDADEIDAMRRAAAVSGSVYGGMLHWIEAGMREIDIAAELEFRARKAGAEGMSFETIVASGERSSMPHARATTAVIEAGSLLTIDFGVVLDGYCSDMTRTISLIGAPSRKAAGIQAEQRRVFEAVLHAQEAAVAAVRAGVRTGEVDEAARGSLRRAGLAKHFTHSTGHGVGLEIHEAPRVAAKLKEPLQEGMVITVEPGVYLPGQFGVRIEDTVVVTADGCEVLTPSYKGWLEL